jgi:hypothetical protein
MCGERQGNNVFASSSLLLFPSNIEGGGFLCVTGCVVLDFVFFIFVVMERNWEKLGLFILRLIVLFFDKRFFLFYACSSRSSKLPKEEKVIEGFVNIYAVF